MFLGRPSYKINFFPSGLLINIINVIIIFIVFILFNLLYFWIIIIIIFTILLSDSHSHFVEPCLLRFKCRMRRVIMLRNGLNRRVYRHFLLHLLPLRGSRTLETHIRYANGNNFAVEFFEWSCVGAYTHTTVQGFFCRLYCRWSSSSHPRARTCVICCCALIKDVLTNIYASLGYILCWKYGVCLKRGGELKRARKCVSGTRFDLHSLLLPGLV